MLQRLLRCFRKPTICASNRPGASRHDNAIHGFRLQIPTAHSSIYPTPHRWLPRSTRDRLALMLVDAHSMSGHPAASMSLLRAICVRWPASVAAWSSYSRDSVRAGTVRSWPSHVATSRKRCPGSIPIIIMQVLWYPCHHCADSVADFECLLAILHGQGHAYIIQRMYIEALNLYFQAYRFWPAEPIILLSIGCAYINLATTRKVPDRNRAVLTGFAFMQVSGGLWGLERELRSLLEGSCLSGGEGCMMSSLGECMAE